MKNLQVHNQKLRVVTRQDLPIGVQATQSGHAAIDYQHEYPQDAIHWHKNSNYLIFLTSDDQSHLERLIHKADTLGIKYTIFKEPDLNNEITAVTFEPSDDARRITSSLPLLGSAK